MSLKEIWSDGLARYREEWTAILANDAWSQEDPRVILAVFAGILAVAIWCWTLRGKIRRRKRQKETAIREGKVIRAKKVRIFQDYREDDTTREVLYRGTYAYTIDGKTRHYRVHSRSGLPSAFLTLYYTDSPRKVFSDYDNLHQWYSVSILAGIAACLLTMYLTGYFS